MITIAEIVEKKLNESPFLIESLSEGLINISSLARKIQSEIEISLKKEVKQGAIIMAINRLPLTKYKRISNQVVKAMRNIGDIIVRSDLVSYTFSNSVHLRKSQTQLMQLLENSLGVFFSFSQGVHETTIVISNSFEAQMGTIFKEETLVKKTAGLSSIIMKLPENNAEISGLYYYLLKDLALQGINILEVISTTNEFNIVVSEANINRAFLVMMKLKKGS